MNLCINAVSLDVDCKVPYQIDTGMSAVAAEFCTKACGKFTFPVQDGDFFQEKECKSVTGSKSV